MKMEDVKKMTGTELRMMVAELCGWTELLLEPDGFLWGVSPDGKPEESGGWRSVPDYEKDLNAMHEAERILRTGKQMNRCVSERNKYGNILEGMCGRGEAWEATARQRAEAFVVAMEWK